ncbi:MAG: sugar phosphate isomerase/epimerase [Clostridia bacterium]|nr:sugar phosphate isomerase/epimerase [Clostridia bacterium]
MLYGSQLFSLRKYCKTPEGVADTFRKVKEMGAETVQLSAICPMPAAELKKLSEDNALSICGTHTPFIRLKGELDKVAEEHLTYGATIVGIGSMPSEFRGSLDGIKRFEDFANETAKKLAPYGLKFAYHNHNFEFKTENGETYYDHMISNTDPSVQFILDTYWIVMAGYQPLEYIRKLKGRLDLIHLKDYKKFLFLPLMKEVGYGTIDFVEIMKAAEEAGTKYAVAELDISFNPMKSMQMSLEYMNTVLKA